VVNPVTTGLVSCTKVTSAKVLDIILPVGKAVELAITETFPVVRVPIL